MDNQDRGNDIGRDRRRHGVDDGAGLFLALLAVIAVLCYRTSISRVTLFWAAFILTRPLGATVGDFFDKPVAQGGLDMSGPLASAILAAFIVACILIIPQRPAARNPVGEGQTG